MDNCIKCGVRASVFFHDMCGGCFTKEFDSLSAKLAARNVTIIAIIASSEAIRMGFGVESCSCNICPRDPS